MNLFYVEREPVAAAQALCDKHVVKMILETAQMLSTAHRLSETPQAPFVYKVTHRNHPKYKVAQIVSKCVQVGPRAPRGSVSAEYSIQIPARPTRQKGRSCSF